MVVFAKPRHVHSSPQEQSHQKLTVTTPISRTTTPWNSPSTRATVSGTAAAAGSSSRPPPPLLLVRPLPRGPSADEDMRRAGGSPRASTSSAVAPAAAAQNTIILEEHNTTGAEGRGEIDWRLLVRGVWRVSGVARRVWKRGVGHTNGKQTPKWLLLLWSRSTHEQRTFPPEWTYLKAPTERLPVWGSLSLSWFDRPVGRGVQRSQLSASQLPPVCFLSVPQIHQRDFYPPGAYTAFSCDSRCPYESASNQSSSRDSLARDGVRTTGDRSRCTA